MNDVLFNQSRKHQSGSGFKLEKAGAASKQNTRYDSFENILNGKDKDKRVIYNDNQENESSIGSINNSGMLDEKYMAKFEEKNEKMKNNL